MESTQTEKNVVLKIAPVQDRALRFISKKRTQPIDRECTERKYCLLEDGLVASWYSQLYYLNALMAKHRNSVRVLANSKSVRVDEELTMLIAQSPELSDFDLSSGNPGIYYLGQKMLTGLEASELLPGSALIGLGSSHEWSNLFMVMSAYSFYKDHKKKFANEFSAVEAEMKSIVDKYGLQGRYSWNAFVDKTARPKKRTPDSAYLDKYRSQNI